MQLATPTISEPYKLFILLTKKFTVDATFKTILK